MLGEPNPGNSANWLRIFGRRSACSLEVGVLLSKATTEGLQVSVTRKGRLFNKNAGDCKCESMSTVSDACPVPVCDTQVQLGEAPVNGGGNSDRRKVA